MPPSEPLLVWTDALTELVGFIASFFAAGAIGFRFAVLRPFTAPRADADERQLAGRLAARVAWLGVIGAWVTAGFVVLELRDVATEKHLAIVALVQSMPDVQVQVTCVILAAVGFVLATRGSNIGWLMAGIGVVAAPFRGLITGDIFDLVKSVHALAGGLWVGTLFCLAVFAIPAVLRSRLSSERRGAAVATLVRAFSPLALVAVPVLIGCGVITAWRNLHGWEHLWSTPYGYALLAKLALVAAVAGFGAWNWRRQLPRLGSESTARDVWRSARAEVSIAGLVLLVTAILVSLPSPEPPGR